MCLDRWSSARPRSMLYKSLCEQVRCKRHSTRLGLHFHDMRCTVNMHVVRRTPVYPLSSSVRIFWLTNDQELPWYWVGCNEREVLWSPEGVITQRGVLCTSTSPHQSRKTTSAVRLPCSDNNGNALIRDCNIQLKGEDFRYYTQKIPQVYAHQSHYRPVHRCVLLSDALYSTIVLLKIH